MRSCASRNEEEGGSEELEKGMVRREALSSAWRIKGVQKRIINRISGGPKKSRRPASHMIRGLQPLRVQPPSPLSSLPRLTAHSVLVMNPISYAAYTSHSKNALYLSISHFWLVPRT